MCSATFSMASGRNIRVVMGNRKHPPSQPGMEETHTSVETGELLHPDPHPPENQKASPLSQPHPKRRGPACDRPREEIPRWGMTSNKICSPTLSLYLPPLRTYVASLILQHPIVVVPLLRAFGILEVLCHLDASLPPPGICCTGKCCTGRCCTGRCGG